MQIGHLARATGYSRAGGWRGLEGTGSSKQDFVYLSDEDAYRCPAGEKLIYHYTNEEAGQQLGAIGPMRAMTAQSKPAARPAKTGGLRAGSMSTLWKRCRGASTITPKPCGGDGRLSNIRSAR
jgi:hypothetical protein